MQAYAQKKLMLNQKPLVTMKASKQPLKKNPTALTTQQAIAALSKDPKNQDLVKKLQNQQPLTKKNKAYLNQVLGINNNLALTNTNLNLNVNNLTIFNNNTSSNVSEHPGRARWWVVSRHGYYGGQLPSGLRYGCWWSVRRRWLATRMPFRLFSQRSCRFR